MNALAARALVAVVVGLLASGVLAGCGGDGGGDHRSTSASDEAESNGIAEAAAKVAVEEATRWIYQRYDLTYRGKTTIPAENGTFKVKTVWTVADEGCQLNMSGPQFGNLVIRQIVRNVYIRGDSRGLQQVFGLTEKQAAAAAASAGDRWFRTQVSAGDSAECEIRDVVTIMQSATSYEGSAEVVVRDVPTRKLVGATFGQRRTLFVATVGEPRVMRVAGPNRYGRFDLRLVDVDTGKLIEMPGQADVIDLDE